MEWAHDLRPLGRAPAALLPLRSQVDVEYTRRAIDPRWLVNPEGTKGSVYPM